MMLRKMIGFITVDAMEKHFLALHNDIECVEDLLVMLRPSECCLSSSFEDEDCDCQSSFDEDNAPLYIRTTKRERASTFPQEVTDILMAWANEHVTTATGPYPTQEEKDILCADTGLTLTQLNNWFSNWRRRSMTELQQKEYVRQATRAGGVVRACAKRRKV